MNTCPILTLCTKKKPHTHTHTLSLSLSHSPSRKFTDLLSSTESTRDAVTPQFKLKHRILIQLISSELQLNLGYSSSGVEAFGTGSGA